jgi:hypothetical protein
MDKSRVKFVYDSFENEYCLDLTQKQAGELENNLEGLVGGGIEIESIQRLPEGTKKELVRQMGYYFNR